MCRKEQQELRFEMASLSEGVNRGQIICSASTVQLGPSRCKRAPCQLQDSWLSLHQSHVPCAAPQSAVWWLGGRHKFLLAGSCQYTKLYNTHHACAELFQERIDAFELASAQHEKQLADLETNAKEALEKAQAGHETQVSWQPLQHLCCHNHCLCRANHHQIAQHLRLQLTALTASLPMV